MEIPQKKQKLYAYVDESGQDDSSNFFIVVAVVSVQNQEALRRQLEEVEQRTQTNKLKWHKSRHDRRVRYLSLILDRKLAAGEVYTARYRKPLPYFFPILSVLEKAIKMVAAERYTTNIYVDGIDRRKAKQLTNALRSNGISLRTVKSRRDESEPVIRLADMWAGCIRSALLGHKDTEEIVKRARREGYLHDLTK